MNTNECKTQLEKMIDVHGMESVLYYLKEIVEDENNKIPERYLRFLGWNLGLTLKKYQKRNM